MTIATDIICGFPTESPEDFAETVSLCEKYKFPSLFINQFYPRPGTPAAKMDRIPAHLVKERTKELTELFNSYFPYANRTGEEQEVLVTDISHDKKYYVAHNISYEQVLVPKQDNLMGKLIKVIIYETSKFSMKGKLIDENKLKMPGLTVPLPLGSVSGYRLNDFTDNSSNENVYKYAIIVLFIAYFYYLYKTKYL